MKLFYNIGARQLDVSKIHRAFACYRQFCIFDRDLPCRLNIEYERWNEQWGVAPIIGGGSGAHFALHTTNSPIESIEIRFATLDEASEHVNAIYELQQKLKRYRDIETERALREMEQTLDEPRD